MWISEVELLALRVTVPPRVGRAAAADAARLGRASAGFCRPWPRTLSSLGKATRIRSAFFGLMAHFCGR